MAKEFELKEADATLAIECALKYAQGRAVEFHDTRVDGSLTVLKLDGAVSITANNLSHSDMMEMAKEIVLLVLQRKSQQAKAREELAEGVPQSVKDLADLLEQRIRDKAAKPVDKSELN